MNKPQPYQLATADIVNRITALERVVSHGMSEFQMQHFVLDETYTPYRRLRQSIIESSTRMEVATDLQKKIDTVEDELQVERLTRQLNSVLREVDFFNKAAADIVTRCYDNDWDKALAKLEDPDYVYQEEARYWLIRFAEVAVNERLSAGVISQGTIGAIRQLPAHLQSRCVDHMLTLERQALKNMPKLAAEQGGWDRNVALANKG